MLQLIRDKVQGWIAGFIAFAIALTFAFWGIQNFRGSKSRAVAKVNGQVITQEQLSAATDQVRKFYLESRVTLDQKAQLELKGKILHEMIKQQAIADFKKKLKLSIDNNYLLGLVRSIPFFQEDGRFSAEKYRKLISGVGRSEAEFLQNLVNEITDSQLNKGIVDSDFALDYEKNLLRKTIGQRRDFSYLEAPYIRFSMGFEISDYAVTSYYQGHQQEFLTAEKVSLEYVVLSREELMARVETQESVLKEYYLNHSADYTTFPEWQLKEFLVPIVSKDKKQVDRAIEILGKAPASELEGKGALSEIELKTKMYWVSADKLSHEMRNRLNDLKVGQLSEPFKQQSGVARVKVMEIKPAKELPYEQVKNRVKEDYRHRRASELFMTESDRLVDLAYHNPDDLSVVSEVMGLKIKVTDLVARDGAKSGILANPRVVKAAFGGEVLNQRYNSELVELEPGKVIVLRIKEYEPEKVKPLKSVYSEIVSKLRYEEAKVRAKNFTEQLVLELKAPGTSLAELAKQHQLTLKQEKNIRYFWRGKNSELVKAVYGLSQQAKDGPSSNKLQPFSSTVIELDGDKLALVVLDKVYQQTSSPKTKQASSKQLELASDEQEQALERLDLLFGETEYQNLLKIIVDQAEVEIFDKSLKEGSESS